mmetsp:Transcript_20391/g.33756  ORF Transcript_20391/g.33756 Transcript_20391/m.33756 type:complete len:548 (-) Transcript_20391:18-1661(-)
MSMMTTPLSSLLVTTLMLCSQSVHSFLPPRATTFTRKHFIQRDTDGPAPEEFNDFGDFVPGDATTPSVVQELQQLRDEKSAQLAQNWQQGNWKVRGFSLDPYSAIDDNHHHQDDGLDKSDDGTTTSSTTPEKTNKAIISKIILSDDDGVAVIGRSDGSVCLIELGTEYWTKFDSKLTATETSNSTVKVESQLVRQEDPQELVSESPFIVTAQFMAHEGVELTALLVVAGHENNDDMVVTATASGQMTAWSVDDDNRVIPLRNLEAHSQTIVGIKAVPQKEGGSTDLMVSASMDGSIALWDLWTGDLVVKCQMEQEDGEHVEITCLDATKDGVVFLGLSTGHVVAYLVPEMVQAASMGNACPVPNGRFMAHQAEGGITSLCCGGDGNLAPSSSILITGGADGSVKQWEILPRSSVSSTSSNDDDHKKTTTTLLEHWPRLATQRMPKRAHVFCTRHYVGGDEAQDSITALASHGDNKILSASADGTVRAWSPTTGKELYVMAGFSSSLTSLCLNQDVLVTNGMDQFVCVHDFDVNQADFERDGLESIDW